MLSFKDRFFLHLRGTSISLLFFLLFSCASIASLADPPVLLNRDEVVSLRKDEAALYDYCLYLYSWLVDASKYISAHYPFEDRVQFEEFDASYTFGSGKSGISNRIKYFKRYIDKNRPIALYLYHKYSGLGYKGPR
ncbi:hypothetical protein F0310_04435 (plasmid) [Borrelia sp. A-FGy1]|uniref:BBA14 family lipoprotein n=1 Tax=Borrelia sp. A-FGy1 TaxID=2608247 RepID=UPI0015F57F4C|nr:BBA14 family lipoprotein [Borrelia sp. A-FGy1]QMU99661.1 hypothetical protein F0310_04435 [Borrelia sp. A-FGy1]